jgi:hypothetical protein
MRRDDRRWLWFPSSAWMNIIHERCSLIRSVPQICTMPGGKGWKRLNLEEWLHTRTIISAGPE